jgi:hypothetical protein
VIVAQLVRAPDCDSGGRGFEPRLSPFFYFKIIKLKLAGSMTSWLRFNQAPLQDKISTLFKRGTFVVSIRYYGYKVNLYQLGNDYVEVFVNHKRGEIEKVVKLDTAHSRMKFYCDQIRLDRL